MNAHVDPTAGEVEAPRGTKMRGTRYASGAYQMVGHMHRVHTDLVGPAPGEMRWDNYLSEFFYLIKGTIVNL